MQKHGSSNSSNWKLRFIKDPPAVMLILFAVLSLSVFTGIYDKQTSFPEYVGKDLNEEEMAEVIERNSPLTSYVHLSPNADFPRDSAIQKITIHHMGANLTLVRLGESFSKRDRGASSNYGIDVDGNIALYVEEADRAWTSSSPENDNMAVTIEVANESTGGDWPVSDSSFESLIELCTDICLRNGIDELVYTGDADGNLTIHKMFSQNTDCPGPYLESRMEEIAEMVNENIKNHGERSYTPAGN